MGSNMSLRDEFGDGLTNIPREYNDTCLKIKGSYRKELEFYIAQRVKENDMFIGVCKCVFAPEPMIGYGFVIRCSHNREQYHNPKKEDVLKYFLEFLEANPIGKCHYCGETVNKRVTNSFCGKDVCSKCEEIGKEIIIRRNMEADLNKWEGKENE